MDTDPARSADQMMLKLWNANIIPSIREKLVDEVQTTLCSRTPEDRTKIVDYIVGHQFSDHRFPSHGYHANPIRNDDGVLTGFQFAPNNPSSIEISTDCAEE